MFIEFSTTFKKYWKKSTGKGYYPGDNKVYYSCTKKAEKIFSNWNDCLNNRTVSEIEFLLGPATSQKADNLTFTYHLGKNDKNPAVGRSLLFILNDTKDTVQYSKLTRWTRFDH